MAEHLAATVFDETYYAGIWGSVHRHDYTAGLADRLAQTCPHGRVLDIGTGCGHLVKMLRERGIEAWGLECSDHAVRNSCAPQYVLHGSVTDLPWKDGYFDIVHSQGLWEYISEADIAQAWAECLRVGRQQWHNYETSDTCPNEYQYVTYRPRAWWEARLQEPRILVACPTHVSKAYAWERWVASVRAFTYPRIDVLVMDNSPEQHFFTDTTHDPLIMVEHAPVETTSPELRMNTSMERIREHFLAGPWTHWFNVEADILPPPDAIEQMLKWGKDSAWVSCGYPSRTGTENLDVQQGIGCSLLSRRLVERFSFVGAGGNYTPDGWLWSRVRPEVRDFPTMELWGFQPVQHLRESSHETRGVLCERAS